jgi:uncharacterized protein YndB with AHSA1/START domain
VEVRSLLPAPPEVVYEVLADPTTFPAWLVGAQRIRSVDPAFPAPATRFEHSVGPAEPATVDDETRAVAADAPHRLVLDVHAGPLKGLVDFGLQEHPGGTQIVFRETPTGALAPLTPLLRPALYLRNAESLRRLARYVARRPSPR